MSAKKHLTEEEKKYILDFCDTKSSIEISKHLDRDHRTIKGFIKELSKQAKKSKNPIVIKASEESYKDLESKVTQRLDEEGREDFFRGQLKNSLFYKNLKIQFVKDEIDFYLEEWGALCVQFEDIVATEKRQIDELIKAEIMGNRILRNIRIAEDEIEKLQKEIDEFRENNTLETSELAQERDMQLINLVRTLSGQAAAMSNDYKSNVDLRNRLLEQLNARRRDRVEQSFKSGNTFIGIVKALQDKEYRDTQARYIEMVKLAKDKKLDEWHKPSTFPGGSKDCVIMDVDSKIEDNRVFIDVPIGKSEYLDYFINTINKRVLLVEDDHSRKQFFLDKLSRSIIDLASDADKATEFLRKNEYDFILFDYDLGSGQKSETTVRYMIDKNRSPNAKVLIHSMNQDGADKLKVMLHDERPYEIVKFSDIHKYYMRESGKVENAQEAK